MKQIALIDTETATLGAGVVELGMLYLDSDLNIIKEYSVLVNPGMKIEQGAFEVHGISDDEVSDKPTMDTLYAHPVAFDWIGYNCEYDIKVCSPHILPARSLCVLKLARSFLKGLPDYKLSTLKRELNLSEQESHRALGDCFTTLEVLKVVQQVSGLTLDQMFDRSNAPKMLMVMPFGRYKGSRMTSVPESYRKFLLQQDWVAGDLRYTLQRLVGV